MKAPEPGDKDDGDDRERAQQRLEFYQLAQQGVFSHAQLRACLLNKNDIARMVRRRELRRVHPRVYVDHTGPLTRAQQEWAALLYAEPAALCRAMGAVDAARVTGKQLRAALTLHHSLRRRRFVASLIDDVVNGTHSVLEHGYLTRVERPHGLPSLQRQVERTSVRGKERRDGEYAAFGLVVELDGRLSHGAWNAGNRDAARDLDDLAAGRSVARLRYGQVFSDACRTADLMAKALTQRGWTGRPRRCGPACTIDPG